MISVDSSFLVIVEDGDRDGNRWDWENLERWKI